MRNLFWIVFLTVATYFVTHLCIAQPITEYQTGIRRERRIDQNTLIFDKLTGKKIPFKEYTQLTGNDPYAYYLEPVYNEYGQESSYKLRPTTAEERETHSFYPINPAERPKVGETMPLFVMKGMDGKVYRSTDLQGRVVVLSFWVSLKKPFWDPKQTKAFADLFTAYQPESGPISLGILQESKQSLEDFMASEALPFIPIPNSYGFNSKFHITAIPSFIVIDRAGKVAAYVEQNYDQLKEVLQKVSQ